jgi:uncharacterized membrane protein
VVRFFVPMPQWMLWNLMLAAIPVALACVLFRRRAQRNVAWWALLVMWVLFLPNAPYVLTDVVHMIDSMQNTSTRIQGYALLLVYASFFAAGLACYVVALQLCRRYIHSVAPQWVVAPALLVLHGACVVAMYLGRVVRLNSWDVVVAPGAVLRSVLVVPRPFTIALLIAMFFVTGFAAYATKVVGDQVLAAARRLL